MPLDPSIALSVQPPRFNDPFAQLAQIRAQQQEQALRDQQIRANQALEAQRRQDIATQARQEADAQSFFTLLSEADTTPDNLAEKVRVRVPSLYQGFLKTQGEIAAKAAELKKSQAELALKGQEYAQPFLQIVERSGYNPQVFDFALKQIQSHFEDFPADDLRMRAQAGPDAIKQIIDGFKSPAQQQADLSRQTYTDDAPQRAATLAKTQQEVQGTTPITPYQRASLNQQAAQAAATARRETEWVMRGGQAVQIRKGTAQPGDIPYKAGIELDAEIPSNLKTALDRAVMSVPERRRGTVIQTANRLWSEGNQGELKEVIRQAALEGEDVTTKGQIRSRQATIAALEDTKTMLDELKAAGVPTGWFTGTVEDLVRRIGETTDPRRVALKNRLLDTLIQYRRAATGAAFGEKEGQTYAQMFPNYSQSMPVNQAAIEGLIRAMRGNDQTYWESKLGKEGAALVGAIASPAASGSGFRVVGQRPAR